VVTGLKNGRVHTFVVRAVTAAGVSSWLTISRVVTPQATSPAAISNLTAAAGSRSVTLTWAAPASDGGSPITNYEIMVAEQTAGVWSPYRPITRPATTATFAVVNDLTNNKPHIFVVRAVTAAGVSPWLTLSRAVTPQATNPAAITNLTATAGSRSVTLNWAAPASDGGSPITNYEIMVAEQTAGVWSPYRPLTRPASTATSAVVNDLTNGKPHLFVVRAVTAAGVSPWLTLARVVTPKATNPGAILNLTATPGNQSVTLNWSTPANDGGLAIANYEIMVAEQTGGVWSPYRPVTRPASIATSATVTGLTNDKIHIFVVRAVTAFGAGPWATLSPAVAPRVTLPDSVSNLTATPGNQKVVLNWSAPANNGGSPITHYDIMVAEQAGGVWSPYRPVARTASTATSAVLTGLTNDKIYMFVVRAVTAVGASPWVPLSRVVAPKATTPGEIANLTATPGDRSVALKWSAPADNGGSPITNYEIMVAEQTGNVWSPYRPVARTMSNDTSAVVTGLTNNKIHIFVVRSVTAVGASSWVTLSPVVMPRV
jgi:titin